MGQYFSHKFGDDIASDYIASDNIDDECVCIVCSGIFGHNVYDSIFLMKLCAQVYEHLCLFCGNSVQLEKNLMR
jgi:hypothetical protein